MLQGEKKKRKRKEKGGDEEGGGDKKSKKKHKKDKVTYCTRVGVCTISAPVSASLHVFGSS